jgi:hypothetical protein
MMLRLWWLFPILLLNVIISERVRPQIFGFTFDSQEIEFIIHYTVFSQVLQNYLWFRSVSVRGHCVRNQTQKSVRCTWSNGLHTRNSGHQFDCKSVSTCLTCKMEECWLHDVKYYIFFAVFIVLRFKKWALLKSLCRPSVCPSVCLSPISRPV